MLEVQSIVLAHIHPRKQFEISPDQLVNYIEEYGLLQDAGKPCDLVGVRLKQHPHTISWASYYWCPDREKRWSRWCITTLSGTVLMIVER